MGPKTRNKVLLASNQRASCMAELPYQYSDGHSKYRVVDMATMLGVIHCNIETCQSALAIFPGT